MSNILIIDTETTGLEPHDEIIEVALAILDLDTKSVIACGSTIIKSDVPNLAEFVNGITPPMIEKGLDRGFMSPWLADYVEAFNPLMVVAHNADFDKGMLTKAGVELELQWICSKEDLGLRTGASTKLSHIGVDAGIPIVRLHRALDDTLLLAEILSKIDNLPSALLEAVQPKALFRADVVYQTRQLARDAGFRWNPEEQHWEKKMPRDTPIEKTDDRPFRVYKIHDL